MGLGQRKLFDHLTTPAPAQLIPLRKGRSTGPRKDYILNRYAFLKASTKYSYEALVAQVAFEVWLSDTTIIEMLMDNSDELRRIYANPSPVSELRKKWPHINW